MIHSRTKMLRLLFAVPLLVSFFALLCAQGCGENREAVNKKQDEEASVRDEKREALRKKQDRESRVRSQQISEENKLNEKLCLISIKFGVEPDKVKTILKEYTWESRDDTYAWELRPELIYDDALKQDFERANDHFYAEPDQSVNYQSIIEQIHNHHNISRETIAAIVIEYKLWSHLDNIEALTCETTKE